eukprot:TRINITY_DN685_c0_g1::TRINITY_DN685_c0_g1_i1::g.28875::m.28875 TRINITY_DN685_c0_g1::TRINITY_DN685_c0_g1_i1::g.28875  ORF type:complete len:242 (+),score=60.57,sp/Q5RB77/PDCL3_PONAB/38.76/9e-39,Phosducin/PF02114.11/5.5e-13,Thioredoxin/PF00085.15/0.0098,EF-1_beta_acid/PF10587.4/0.26 TRINITY_DN685_c0_g1_i1:65-727(+)
MSGETEWETIQRRMGNLPPKEVEISQDTIAELAEQAAQNYDPLKNKSLDQLNDMMDDDLGSDDEKELEAYRQQRIREMKEKAAKARYGGLTHIRATDYKDEVNCGDVYVVVLLYQHSNPDCEIMEASLAPLSRKFRDVKFLAIKSTDAIPNYPDKLLPTVLVYHQNDIVKQYVGLGEFGGKRMTPGDVEWQLAQLGAVETDLEEPPSISTPGRIKLNITR